MKMAGGSSCMTMICHDLHDVNTGELFVKESKWLSRVIEDARCRISQLPGWIQKSMRFAGTDSRMFVADSQQPKMEKNNDDERNHDVESVRVFSQKMAVKLAKGRASGRHGWRDVNIVSDKQLLEYLHDNLDRQQYVDVANYAMMLYFREIDRQKIEDEFSQSHDDPPNCPRCGNSHQVWRNQISGKWTCHRAYCNTVIKG